MLPDYSNLSESNFQVQLCSLRKPNLTWPRVIYSESRSQASPTDSISSDFQVMFQTLPSLSKR